MTTNPWINRRVVNFAHQGGSHEGPSSTLWAIGNALRCGATAIELDVHATKDRQLVVCHDETVNRTTNGTGEICDLTLDQLRQLDNAYAFIEGADVTVGRDEGDYPWRGRAPEDRAFGIATLDEVLDLVPGVPLNLDIKRTAPVVEPYEELLASTLAAHGRTDDVIVASFNDLAIRAFRACSPSTPTSAATMETAQFWRSAHDGEGGDDLDVVALQVPASQGDLQVVDEVLIDAAHAQEIAVHVWTVNDPDEVERLVALGVDGIISDRPTMVTAVLGDHAWDGTP